MSAIKYQEIMWATMQPDCYDGENCDQIRPQWNAYADGDKEGGFEDLITLNPSNFPPGTKVVISVPCCPYERCGLPAFDVNTPCNCGFDWKEWTLNKYS